MNKNRFKELLRSTMGDVRPLVLEQNEPPPFIPQTPLTSSPTPPEQPNDGKNKYYVVKQGDTLSKIAKNNNMELNRLLYLNPKYEKNPNSVKVGDQIIIFDAELERTKGWSRTDDLKKELISLLKGAISRMESKSDITICDILTKMHFELTEFYENPYVREKGWNPEECTNFNQLDSLMKK